MSVYDITLTDPTESVAPPERVLRVTSVNELAFISIEEYDEDGKTRTFKVVAQMAVSLPGLRESLGLLGIDGQREDMRERDKNGPGARIGGLRTTVVPL